MREIILYHMLGFFAGFVLDLVLGDPYWLPHPVRAIGNLIAKLEAVLLKKRMERIERKMRNVRQEEFS